ncbi:MAG: hypothetical protein ACFFFG_17870 [Candidatus Thorarchaeota archaeon]
MNAHEKISDWVGLKVLIGLMLFFIGLVNFLMMPVHIITKIWVLGLLVMILGGNLLLKHTPSLLIGQRGIAASGVPRICPECQFANRSDSVRCNNCGTALPPDEQDYGGG